MTAGAERLEVLGRLRDSTADEVMRGATRTRSMRTISLHAGEHAARDAVTVSPAPLLTGNGGGRCRIHRRQIGAWLAWFLRRSSPGDSARGGRVNLSRSPLRGDVRELPMALRTVSGGGHHLPTGTSRDLLMEVLLGAAAVLAARASARRALRTTSSRENAGALLGACCGLAR